MSDELETRVQVRKWFVETGYIDGNGVGLWDQTEESVEVVSKAEAEALRDAWEASGKLERTRWGDLRLRSPYGAFRIRSTWEDVPSAAITSLRADLAAAQARVGELEAEADGHCDRAQAYDGERFNWQARAEKAEAEHDAALTFIQRIADVEWEEDEPASGWMPNGSEGYVAEMEHHCNWTVKEARDFLAGVPVQTAALAVLRAKMGINSPETA